MSSVLVSILFWLSSAVTVCPSGCDSSTIGDAVRRVGADSEIVVQHGEYHETLPIVVERPVTIRGEEFPVISGDGSLVVFVITASGVKIQGLEVRNTGASYVHELSAFRAEGVDGCTLQGNTIRNAAFGIYLANARHCLVSDNSISSRGFGDSEAGNGIHSWSGANHTIEDNRVEGHRDGIYLEFTNDSHISGNRVKSNLRYGLHFMTSHRNEYRGNRFEKNGAGVAVMYSSNVKMFDNVFANNTGAAAYGLLLKDILAGEIRGNTFEDNTFGIYAEGTNRTLLTANVIRNNGYGLRIFADCDNNTIAENNFVGNTFDVVTNSSSNPNTFHGNYWSNYGGYDLDRDGHGDIPYRPVSLSSVLTEKFDSTYLLIKSPLFNILDRIEQALPMLIPENLKDDSPLMEPKPVQTAE